MCFGRLARTTDSKVNPLQTRTVDSNGVHLYLRLLGDPHAPHLVMLHGMHDVGGSLLPIAERLATRFRVVLPDLRGHGASDRPGAYSMPAFVFDLHRILASLELHRPLLFGHSLGGQILTRFAALYPDRVQAMVVVEGLGPPQIPGHHRPEPGLRREADLTLQTLTATPRQLPDRGHAVERLCRSNPRLSRTRAEDLVTELTQPTDNGQFEWAFDSRVASLFVAPEDAPRYWPHVQCPTLIVAGALAGEYWRRLFPDVQGWDGEFTPGELEARAALFRDHELTIVEDAGHMTHFDQPDQVTARSFEFLTRQVDG